MAALQAVDELVLDKSSRKWKEVLGGEFSHLVYDGRWFTPLKDSILAGAESLAKLATGEVVLKLYKGQVTAGTEEISKQPLQRRFCNLW